MSPAKVSDKIRALDEGGYPRAEIARMLGKRYQHVRNVLEADKQHGRPARAPTGSGMQESATVFGRTVRLVLDDKGRATFPPAVLAAMGSRSRGVLIAELQEDRLVIFSHKANWAEIDAMTAPYRDPTRSIVDELIAERQAENERDSRDG